MTPNSKPIISLIIPVLNEEKLLEATLGFYTSELKSAFGVEIVVSDGGSTDESMGIAERLADVVVRHSSGKKQTIAEGRNLGAERASGSVLAFINADTYPYNPHDFFTQISKFAERQGKYSKASALACPVRFAPDQQKFKDVLFHGFYNNYVWLLSLFRIGAGRGECQIVRTDVFKAVGGYRSNLAAGEDFDLFARIGMRARVRFARELLVVESPRRFRKFGYFRVVLWWTLNALSVMFRGKSSSDEWEPVR
ncbi:MAG: glycosyltransferase [Ignavibacteria bacterium]|nr:glycosyltransferase [Ignavibacteria bacterium]